MDVKTHSTKILVMKDSLAKMLDGDKIDAASILFDLGRATPAIRARQDLVLHEHFCDRKGFRY